MWKGKATANRAADYVRHATTVVFPKLREIEGHRGAYLLQRDLGGEVEFVVLTLWDSMDVVRRFSPNPSEAVVEPDARRVLSSFDEFVTHFDVIEERR